MNSNSPDHFHSAFSSTPNLEKSTANPSSPALELRRFNLMMGWLTITKWNYRLVRLLTGLFIPGADKKGVRITQETCAGREAFLVRPEHVKAKGAVMIIHGGGLVIGTNRDVLSDACFWARELGVPVLAPSYGLAPQNPFPNGLNDLHAAWHWLQEKAPSMGVDPSKVVISGVSAGGGLAAALSQRLHDEGKGQPASQLLIYPMLDDRMVDNKELDAIKHRVWNNYSNRFGWTSYLGKAAQHAGKPYAVPARRDDLSGLPPAWIGIGTADLFLDENREYTRRLRDAGVDVTYLEVDGGVHGFDVAETKLGKKFAEAQVDFIKPFVA